jgi:hypothetical protein
MSRLGGVALTSPSLPTARISEYKLNYPPFQILDSNHIPSSTSAGNDLLDFYETLHICCTLHVPADVNEGIWLLSKI